MEHDDGTQLFSFFSGLVLGAFLGAGFALLSAPDSGRRTRRRLRKAAGEIRDTATDRWDDLADDVKGRVDDAIKGARQKLVR
jgi:gas vesicle protein